MKFKKKQTSSSKVNLLALTLLEAYLSKDNVTVDFNPATYGYIRRSESKQVVGNFTVRENDKIVLDIQIKEDDFQIQRLDCSFSPREWKLLMTENPAYVTR